MKKILHESDNIEVISMCLNNLGMLLSKTGDKEKCFRCYKAISEIHPNSYHIQNIPLRGNNLNKFFEEFVDENQSGQREMIDLLFNFTASVEHEIERIKTEILGRQLK